jgi:hypothetical protein
MKKVLLLMVAILMVSSVAMADVIGLYTDASGASCALAPGFNTTATVVHKFTAGATGSRFKATLPAGSNFFSFATGFVPIGSLINDLSLGYGQCLTGSFALGTIVAILGVGAGDVLPADGFPNIIYTDCNFGEYPANGGHFWVGTPPTGACEVATAQSTWGQVKALYR